MTIMLPRSDCNLQCDRGSFFSARQLFSHGVSLHMIGSRFSVTRYRWFTLICLLFAIGAVGDELSKPSKYAPLADVLGQLEMYVKQIESDLELESDYGPDEQDRVLKSANTVIALAQVLGNHDEDSPRKKGAAGMITAARDVSRQAGDYAMAKSAAGKLREALSVETGEEVSWEPVADLQELMKQIPIVNNRLRNGVNGSRFARLIDQNAGHAATLAAMAHVSMFDTDYCIDEEGEALWRTICAEMRDAAAATATAVRQKDQEAAQVGLARLVETCDRCHHAFRD